MHRTSAETALSIGGAKIDANRKTLAVALDRKRLNEVFLISH